MTPHMEELETFLAEKRDAREYRRALAVKMALKGYAYDAICDILRSCLRMDYGHHISIRVIVIDLLLTAAGPDLAAGLIWKEQMMKRKPYDSDLNPFEQICIAPYVA